MMEENYLDINRETWNEKTDIHIDSEFYDQKSFLEGKNSLNSIELDLLGSLKDKKVLHLQCHFGQDTLSLSRLGAKATGVDLSDKAIARAREMAEKLGIDTQFINCDIYSLPDHLDEEFDIVFTSYGTIGWLPDLDRWAKVIHKFLKPDGKFLLVDFHPVVWMFDDDFDKIGYNYFKDEPIIETVNGTYADKNAHVALKTVNWNHSISEILNSLIQNKLEIGSFDEYDYSPYDCFNKTEEFEPKKYRIQHIGNKIPMVYAVVATKKQ